MGADGSSSGLSKNEYGTEFYALDKSGMVKLVAGQEGVIEGRKAPVESMIGNRVYAYVNGKNNLSEINFMGDNGKFLKQLGVSHNHMTKKERRIKKKILSNKPKRGKMGKSRKSDVERNAHMHTTLDHKKGKTRQKLSAKERRVLYESASMAKRKGVSV